MQRRSAFLLGAASALGALPLAARAQSTADTIRLGAVPVEDYALGYYAQQQGFFKQSRLDVDFTMFNGGGAASTALYANALDVTGTNVGSMSAAHVRGLPVNLLCGGSIYNAATPHIYLVTAKDSTIRGAKDLAGKKIALTSIGDLMQAAVMLWIDKNGGDSSQSSFLELATPQMAPAVIAHRVDATILVEPFYTQSKADVRLIATPYDALAKQFQITGWVANNAWLTTNKPAAERFAAAMRSAATWSNAHTSDAHALLAAYTKLDPSVIAATNHVRQADHLDPALIQPVIDVLVTYKMLPRTFPASELFALGDH